MVSLAPREDEGQPASKAFLAFACGSDALPGARPGGLLENLFALGAAAGQLRGSWCQRMPGYITCLIAPPQLGVRGDCEYACVCEYVCVCVATWRVKVLILPVHFSMVLCRKITCMHVLTYIYMHIRPSASQSY